MIQRNVRLSQTGLTYDAFSQIPLKEPDGWIDIGAVVRLGPIKDIKTMLYSFYELPGRCQTFVCISWVV